MNKWLRGTNAIVLSLALIGIFIFLTIFMNTLKGVQWDLTTTKKFTLSEISQNMIKELKNDINIKVFVGGNADSYSSQQILDMVREYSKLTGKITVDEIDMVKQPALAKEYAVDPGGMIVFQKGEEKKNIYFYELFMPGPDMQTYQFIGEEKFTQAIVGLTSTEKHPIYLLTGHGEQATNTMSIFMSTLAGESFVSKELNLYKEGKIPDDAKTLYIIGPQTDISDSELKLIQEYLNGNGKLFLSLGYSKTMNEWKNLDTLIATYGLTNNKAVTIDTKSSMFSDPLTITPSYGFHTIVNKLDELGLVSVMSISTSLGITELPEWRNSLLLKTSDQAYGETDLELLVKGNTTKGAQDISGPLNLGYALESQEREPKAVILSGSSFLLDQLIREQGNRDFALNSAAWLIKKTDSITIRPRTEDKITQAIIYPNESKMIFYGTIVVFPLLILVLGGVIWWRRRRG